MAVTCFLFILSMEFFCSRLPVSVLASVKDRTMRKGTITRLCDIEVYLVRKAVKAWFEETKIESG